MNIIRTIFAIVLICYAYQYVLKHIDKHVRTDISQIGRDDLPSWFDVALLPLLREKWLERKNRKILRFMTAVRFLTPSTKGSPRWVDLETKIDSIKIHNRPDVVVGIKTGGAFIANRVASRWDSHPRGRPYVTYIRLSKYGSLSPMQRIGIWMRHLMSYKANTKGVSVTEAPKKIHIQHKSVLLVDDQCGSGSTLQMARRIMSTLGARKIETFVVSSTGACPTGTITYGGDFPFILVWPWGADA